MSKRMERAPTAEDSRPEAYDEGGREYRARQVAEYEPEYGRGPRVREWWSMRRRGWRKDPNGSGFLCPDASCKTAGDVHSRAHHDRWHDDIRRNFEATDEIVGELRDEIAARDETINVQSDTIDALSHKLDVHSEILSYVTREGVQSIIAQVIASRVPDGSEPVL